MQSIPDFSEKNKAIHEYYLQSHDSNIDADSLPERISRLSSQKISQDKKYDALSPVFPICLSRVCEDTTKFSESRQQRSKDIDEGCSDDDSTASVSLLRNVGSQIRQDGVNLTPEQRPATQILFDDTQSSAHDSINQRLKSSHTQSTTLLRVSPGTDTQNTGVNSGHSVEAVEGQPRELTSAEDLLRPPGSTTDDYSGQVSKKAKRNASDILVWKDQDHDKILTPNSKSTGESSSQHSIIQDLVVPSPGDISENEREERIFQRIRKQQDHIDRKLHKQLSESGILKLKQNMATIQTLLKNVSDQHKAHGQKLSSRVKMVANTKSERTKQKNEIEQLRERQKQLIKLFQRQKLLGLKLKNVISADGTDVASSKETAVSPHSQAKIKTGVSQVSGEAVATQSTGNELPAQESQLSRSSKTSNEQSQSLLAGSKPQMKSIHSDMQKSHISLSTEELETFSREITVNKETHKEVPPKMLQVKISATEKVAKLITSETINVDLPDRNAAAGAVLDKGNMASEMAQQPFRDSQTAEKPPLNTVPEHTPVRSTGHTPIDLNTVQCGSADDITKVTDYFVQELSMTGTGSQTQSFSNELPGGSNIVTQGEVNILPDGTECIQNQFHVNDKEFLFSKPTCTASFNTNTHDIKTQKPESKLQKVNVGNQVASKNITASIFSPSNPKPLPVNVLFKSPPVEKIAIRDNISPSTASCSDVFPVKSKEIVRRMQERQMLAKSQLLMEESETPIPPKTVPNETKAMEKTGQEYFEKIQNTIVIAEEFAMKPTTFTAERPVKTKYPSLQVLIENRALTPGRDCMFTESKNGRYIGSLTENGFIRGPGGEIFKTPVQWLSAVNDGVLVKKSRAYQEILYNGKPLMEYLKSGERICLTQDRGQIDERSNKNTLIEAGNTLEILPFNLEAVLMKCTVKIISDVEIIADSDLPENFWTEDFCNVKLCKTICDEIDFWA